MKSVREIFSRIHQEFLNPYCWMQINYWHFILCKFFTPAFTGGHSVDSLWELVILRSPGIFWVFWSISTVVKFGWYLFFLWFPILPVPFLSIKELSLNVTATIVTLIIYWCIIFGGMNNNSTYTNTRTNTIAAKTGRRRCSGTNGLLISWFRFFDTRRETHRYERFINFLISVLRYEERDTQVRTVY